MILGKEKEMKIKEKININDLYFGMVMNKMNYSSVSERGDIETYNLFDISRVKWSVAKYVTMSIDKRKMIPDPLMFCFGDVWSRTEYEFIMCPWPYMDGEFVEQFGHKVDMYTMYVKPNAELLMDIVNRVTVSSAKKYISDERKRFKR